MHELNRWRTRGKATKRELLSLIGKLSFAARAVPVGRLFLRRLITLASTVARLHHWIRLTAKARANITWWLKFLPTWNGSVKFIDQNSVLAVDMLLYTDASGSYDCGAYYQGAWFFHAWQPHQHLRAIQWKELFAIVAAALTWGHRWQGKQVKVMCDNQVIVLCMAGPALQGLSRHEPYAHVIYVCCTAPLHHHNATSPKKKQLASRCHLTQAIHQILFSSVSSIAFLNFEVASSVIVHCCCLLPGKG